MDSCTGQLPFLTHGNYTVSPLPSIIKYLSGLDESRAPKPLDAESGGYNYPVTPSLDEDLSPEHKSKSVAWRSYIDTHLGDLVLNSFYSLTPNYQALILPTLVSFLPFPQNYYVPGRLRDLYQPRLEAAGLWDVVDDDEKEEVAKDKPSWAQVVRPSVKKARELEQGAEKVKQAFGREKILEKARSTFDLIAPLVSTGSFIYKRTPSSLDIHLAAHILLILHAPLPNPLLKTLILESYPHLVDHALLVRTVAFPSQPLPADAPDSPVAATFTPTPASATRLPYPPVESLQYPTLQTSARLASDGAKRLLSNVASSLFVRRPTIPTQIQADDDERTPLEKTEEDMEKNLSKWRWAWYVGATAGLVGYILLSGMVSVKIVDDGDDDDAGAEEDEDVDEEEES
ncbi:hypothetical protein FRB99_004422 [Tulasnella sp. 403]|nr:hypothetical protein FRB99_004422 [Tulasnella sp. 403]